MKNKVLIIVLIIAFIGIMLLLNNVLKKETDKQMASQNESVNNNNNEKEEKEMTIKVNSENFEEEVLNSEKLVLIDFYADWCGPCKMLSPIVEKVAEENETVKVVKINVDDEQDLAIKYGVMSIPTLVVIKNGQEVNRTVGLISKTEIEKIIK